MNPSYINKKGKLIELSISFHAKCRFASRWRKVFVGETLPNDIEAEICRIFKTASRVINFSKRDKMRLKRYGSDTIFFRSNDFTFVVQDSTILTIEVSKEGMRYLNKRSAKPLPAYAPSTTNVYNYRKSRYTAPDSRPKIVASAITDEGKMRFVGLGRYGSTVEELSTDANFEKEMTDRFTFKHPTWRMIRLYVDVSNKKKGNDLRVVNTALFQAVPGPRLQSEDKEGSTPSSASN